MKYYIAPSLILTALILVFGFQNCSDIKVQSMNAFLGSTSGLEGQFCTGLESGNNSLTAFWIINLNGRVSKLTGLFEPDSDGDGLTDSEEASYGFNELNRRTFGILDSFCLDRGGGPSNPNLCNQNSPLGKSTFGFLKKDFNGMNTPSPGFDSDGDNIPDLVEALFSTPLLFPNTPSDDYDGDGLTDWEEIKRGRTPLSSLDSSLSVMATLQYNYRLNASVPCPSGQTGYSFQIENIPLANTKKFISEDEPELSHDAGENILALFVVSKGPQGRSQFQYHTLKLSSKNPSPLVSKEGFKDLSLSSTPPPTTPPPNNPPPNTPPPTTPPDEGEFYAIFNTNKGTFKVKLFKDRAPNTVTNFIDLAEGNVTRPDLLPQYRNKKFFDGLIFHRVISDYMIQSGDPLGNGTGGPGYYLADETDPSLSFNRAGLLAMAKEGDQTHGSQFFITVGDASHLNGEYTIFGEVTEGYSVVQNISEVPVDEEDKPLSQIKLNSVTIERR